MADLVNTYLGQYWLIEVIGRGNTSTVYKAYQPSLNRYVAVKILRQLDPVSASRFEREAQAIALLRHPNILPIYDYGEHAGLRYFVLQYVENGRTLADMLTGKPIEPLPALRLIRHVLDALDHAHANGVLHRDIKPSNILLMAPTWPLLADFGIAKLTDESRALTPPGQTVGTAMYIAPERANGAPADERSDLYSVGVVLFEMLTGRVPFDAQTPMAALKKHLYEAPPRPRTLNPGVPVAAEALVLRALEKSPHARYQRAADMAAEVALVIADLERQQGQAKPAALPAKRYTTRRFGPRRGPANQPSHGAALGQPWATRQSAPWRLAALMLAVVSLAAIVGVFAYGRLPRSVAVAPDPARGATGSTVALSTEQTASAAAAPTATFAISSPASPTAVAPAPARFFGSEPVAEAPLPPTDPAVPDGGGAPPTAEPPTPTATFVPPTPEQPRVNVAPPTPEPASPSPFVPTPEPASPSPIAPTPTPTQPAGTALSTPTGPPAAIAEVPAAQPVEQRSAAIRLDDTAWRGGYGGANGARTYGGRSAVWIYGTGTSYSQMRAGFTLPAASAGIAFLEIEGMDSEGRTKTPIRIRVNRTEIYAGPNLLPDDDLPLETGTWATARWPFDAALLTPGPNEIEISNLAPGEFGLPPFFMLDYANVIYQLSQ